MRCLRWHRCLSVFVPCSLFFNSVFCDIVQLTSTLAQPGLIAVSRVRRASISKFNRSLFFCALLAHGALSAFFFGWHAHEKALMLPLLPLAIASLMSQPVTASKDGLHRSLVSVLWPLWIGANANIGLLLWRSEGLSIYISQIHLIFRRLCVVFFPFCLETPLRIALCTGGALVLHYLLPSRRYVAAALSTPWIETLLHFAIPSLPYLFQLIVPFVSALFVMLAYWRLTSLVLRTEVWASVDIAKKNK